MEQTSLPEQCEQLMNIVVESRKFYGKMCKDYEEKTSIVENILLNQQIESIGRYRLKSSYVKPDIDYDEMTKDLDNFKKELIEHEKRIDNLRHKVKDTQNVVLQLKADTVGQRLRKPITVEAMLANIRNKDEKI